MSVVPQLVFHDYKPWRVNLSSVEINYKCHGKGVHSLQYTMSLPHHPISSIYYSPGICKTSFDFVFWSALMHYFSKGSLLTMYLIYLYSSKVEPALSFQPSLILATKSTMILLNKNVIKDDLIFIFSLKYTHKSENTNYF